MGFKKYNSIAAYEADTIAPDERRVSIIDDGVNDPVVKYDNPNIHRDLPEVGDALFINNTDGSKLFVKDATGTPSGYTLVGFVFKVRGNKVKILEKTEVNRQWLGCWQYAITAITQTNIRIGLRMSNNYNAWSYVDVTLSSTTINQTTADEISAAVAAKATAVGDTNPWWAWYDSINNRIIVQVDNLSNYQLYNVTGTNCTIALCVWDDMPASNVFLKDTNVSSTVGIINIEKAKAYYSTNGSTPSSDVAINSTAIVNLNSYKTSNYCASLRSKYGNGDEGYENYIKANKVKYPQYYGAFTLPSGGEMTMLYGNAAAPTKTGGTLYKFPALHYGATVNYNSEGLTTGNWHLSDITDCVEYMNDAVLSIIASAQTKMNVTVVSNSSRYCFAQRTGIDNALWYNNESGNIGNTSVYNSRTCRAVTEITI